MVWMVLYILAIWLVGYEYASVAFIFFFMKFQGEQSWAVSILAAIVALAFVMLVFDWGLGINWPDGLLQQDVQLVMNSIKSPTSPLSALTTRCGTPSLPRDLFL